MLRRITLTLSALDSSTVSILWDAVTAQANAMTAQREQGATQFELRSVWDCLWSEKFFSLVIIASYFSISIANLCIHSLYLDFHYYIILKPSVVAPVFSSWVFPWTQSKNNDVFCVCIYFFQCFYFFHSICFVKVAVYLFRYLSQHTTNNLFN